MKRSIPVFCDDSLNEFIADYPNRGYDSKVVSIDPDWSIKLIRFTAGITIRLIYHDDHIAQISYYSDNSWILGYGKATIESLLNYVAHQSITLQNFFLFNQLL